MITIGIDPGLTGAIAWMYGNDYEVHDLPVIRDKSLSWIDGSALQSMIMQFPIVATMSGAVQSQCYIERVSAMPKQGVASSFNFGVGFGSVLSVVQAMHLPLHFITPGSWKRALGLSSDKKASLFKARLLFPNAELHLAKHDGRAEALLIAHYARTCLQVRAVS